jgi:predicted Zn-dependent protease
LHHADDAEDAVRLVAGMLRRGESGEAMREHRSVASWTASEAGLLSPSSHEERGTSVRIRRGGASLLVARAGDGPDALREALREAGRRRGSAPFLKGTARHGPPRPAPPPATDDELAAPVASALARALPDPRGVSLSLVVSLVSVSRSVVTSRAYLDCGAVRRLEANGRVVRGGTLRHVAFQSSLPRAQAFAALENALRDALKPAPRLAPPAGEVDVLLSPSASAVFFHEAVGHPLEAEGAESSSVLARVKGALVGPPSFEVRDDPTRGDLPGAYLVDDEGVAARSVALIQDGRVAALLTDRRTAGAESNGHGRASDYRRPPRARMSNLTVPAGSASFDELLDRCGDGLHVREISGGHADPESGRFVLLVESAETIRRGRLGAPTARFALVGDVLTALRNVDATRGRDVTPASGLAVCTKAGEPLPVGGAAPAVLVRGLEARGLR